MHPTYIKKLGLDIRKINIKTQKIDSTSLETFKRLITAFSVYNRIKIYFFEEIFLMVDINIDVTLRMLFLILSNNKSFSLIKNLIEGLILFSKFYQLFIT